MAAQINAIVPITRNQGQPVPGLFQYGSWVDALVLVANVAQNYVLPTDAAGKRATILRVNANGGPLFVNFNATATIPVANTVTGLASGLLRTDLGPVMLAVPDGRPTPSFIAPAGVTVTIESWR
jgi:hypothetical protein